MRYWIDDVNGITWESFEDDNDSDAILYATSVGGIAQWETNEDGEERLTVPYASFNGYILISEDGRELTIPDR